MLRQVYQTNSGSSVERSPNLDAAPFIGAEGGINVDFAMASCEGFEEQSLASTVINQDVVNATVQRLMSSLDDEFEHEPAQVDRLESPRVSPMPGSHKAGIGESFSSSLLIATSPSTSPHPTPPETLTEVWQEPGHNNTINEDQDSIHGPPMTASSLRLGQDEAERETNMEMEETPSESPPWHPERNKTDELEEDVNEPSGEKQSKTYEKSPPPTTAVNQGGVERFFEISTLDLDDEALSGHQMLMKQFEEFQKCASNYEQNNLFRVAGYAIKKSDENTIVPIKSFTSRPSQQYERTDTHQLHGASSVSNGKTVNFDSRYSSQLQRTDTDWGGNPVRRCSEWISNDGTKYNDWSPTNWEDMDEFNDRQAGYLGQGDSGDMDAFKLQLQPADCDTETDLLSDTLHDSQATVQSLETDACSSGSVGPPQLNKALNSLANELGGPSYAQQICNGTKVDRNGTSKTNTSHEQRTHFQPSQQQKYTRGQIPHFPTPELDMTWQAHWSQPRYGAEFPAGYPHYQIWPNGYHGYQDPYHEPYGYFDDCGYLQHNTFGYNYHFDGYGSAPIPDWQSSIGYGMPNMMHHETFYHGYGSGCQPPDWTNGMTYPSYQPTTESFSSGSGTGTDSRVEEMTEPCHEVIISQADQLHSTLEDAASNPKERNASIQTSFTSFIDCVANEANGSVIDVVISYTDENAKQVTKQTGMVNNDFIVCVCFILFAYNWNKADSEMRTGVLLIAFIFTTNLPHCR